MSWDVARVFVLEGSQGSMRMPRMATSKCVYKEPLKTSEFYYQQFPFLRKLIEDKQRTPEGSVYLSTAVT